METARALDSSPKTKLLRLMLWVNVAHLAAWNGFLFFRLTTGRDLTNESYTTNAIALVVAVLACALTYTRHLWTGGWIMIISSTISTLYAGYVHDPVRAGFVFYFLAVPVMVAALVLSARAALTIFAFSLTGFLGVIWLRGDLPETSTIPAGGFFVYMSAVLIVATFAKERLDRQHATQLTESSKMASLGQMSANLAHEINNPLTVLNLVATQLELVAGQTPPDSKQLQAIAAKIKTMVVRIEEIGKALRRFARDSANEPLQESRLRDIVLSTRELCRHRFQQLSISLKVADIPESAIVACRPVQISQVLVNLLNNAVDAVDSAQDKWVRVGFDDLGDRYQIAVTDSGPGVPPAIRKRIMQPFFTTKGEGKGTGLGLSLSHGIVHDHGGKLYLDPNSTTTRFVMELSKNSPPSTPAPS